MPLIKRDVSAQVGSGRAGAAEHLAALASNDPEKRWLSARSLGMDPAAIPALATALAKENVTRVREAIFTALLRIGGEDSIKVLLPYLRAQDAGLRAAAVDALQALPEAVSPFMDSVLTDPDSDVRLLATELLRKMPAREATSLLVALLERETYPNVCAAAIELLAELGTAEALPALQACGQRFAATPFIPFAAAQAIARISKAGG